MYSRSWVIVTIVLCVIFAALAFPVFVRARGLPTAVVYTLIGLAVMWFAYSARAWVFSRPGFWKSESGGKRGPE